MAQLLKTTFTAAKLRQLMCKIGLHDWARPVEVGLGQVRATCLHCNRTCRIHTDTEWS